MSPSLDNRWRAEALGKQQTLMPSGRAVVSCSAPRGVGGLGRHFEELLGALERNGQATTAISGVEREAAPTASPARTARVGELARRVAGRLRQSSPAKQTRAVMIDFDRYAAARLPEAEHLIAFNGQALDQFRAAGQNGYHSLALVSANSHLRHVIRQHERAHEQYPLERSWPALLLDRNLAEYARADRIYVASRYTRDSFLEQGFDEQRLAMFPFTPDPRYEPSAEPRRGDAFEIVYIGSLTVYKGVPLLIDAVRGLSHADLRLRLIGGWATRGMRRFIQRACAEDPRISHGPGDPLPLLQSASLCVHASYEDGFAYAPAEAISCGVPVIVSEDTGMKDLVDASTGVVLPTGDLNALSAAIDAAYRGELIGG